jgi:hypothetical protein
LRLIANRPHIPKRILRQPQLEIERWQTLIELHRNLLHKHHDFFVASQQPSAPRAVRCLALKHSIPARLRRHGIISFLELLRQRLPASQEHMMAFIDLAYSMMTLLFETVSAFECTWMNSLADIARYTAFIENSNTRRKDLWAGLAEHWSSKAAAKSRRLRCLPLPNLTRFPDCIHQRIARFLSCDDLSKMSLSCKKLRAVYNSSLAEKLRARLKYPLLRILPLSPSQYQIVSVIYRAKAIEMDVDHQVKIVPLSVIN